MLHKSQKLQVEEEMLMHKFYEVMSPHGLTKKKTVSVFCYYSRSVRNPNFFSFAMDPRRFDPTNSAELLKYFAFNLRRASSFFFNLFYFFGKLSDGNSNTIDNVGTLTENNNNEAVAHPSGIATRGQQRKITPFRYTYRSR
ncbi:hypothetical protein Ahy_A09g045142 [Arachis hypogaea]|uniref:Uncharacterized protein n=1 Tax=Arachis hypogaea TaxID=3818 RepID=A0A445BLP1_ARAHY|nr:hypothetical protein Ahy_A09g045142 [Arachis hypogaea]